MSGDNLGYILPLQTSQDGLWMNDSGYVEILGRVTNPMAQTNAIWIPTKLSNFSQSPYNPNLDVRF